MKRQILIAVAFSSLFGLQLQSQEIFTMVLKGQAALEVNGKTKPLIMNLRYALPPAGKLKVAESSRVIVFNKNKCIDAASGVVSKYETLKSNINKEPIMVDFVNYITRNYAMADLGSKSKGSVVAGVKGMNQRQLAGYEEKISPPDSSKVISETVQLSWRIDSNVALGKLLVIHEQTNDTIYKASAREKGSAEIQLTKNGIYKWLIYSSIDRKTRLSSHFIKPDGSAIKKIESDLAQFKKEISGLSQETQDSLIDDYLKFNTIVLE